MVRNDYNLIESVIHITEKRDKRSLEKALVNTLTDFIDFDALILLRVSPISAEENLEIAVSSPLNNFQHRLKLIPHQYGEQLIQRDEVITQCIENAEIITQITDPSIRVMFPVIVNNIVTGILDIYGYRRKAKMDKLITGFIRVYSNFLAIINDNEHDALTGLLNRKTLDLRLFEFLSSSSTAQSDHTLCRGAERRIDFNGVNHWLGILDIDNFKKINDDFGHIYGDEVLLLFSDLMKKTFRRDDLLFRYGGEEFVVVITLTENNDAFSIFERFRQQLELFDFPQVGRVTVSTGMLQIDEKDHPSKLLGQADKALYYAKHHGRNQVCNYDELIKAGYLTERQIASDIELF